MTSITLSPLGIHRNSRYLHTLIQNAKRDSDACPPTQTFASKATELGGKVTVLPVDMKHGELNKELGLPSDYTTTVENFMRSLGLP